MSDVHDRPAKRDENDAWGRPLEQEVSDPDSLWAEGPSSLWGDTARAVGDLWGSSEESSDVSSDAPRGSVLAGVREVVADGLAALAGTESIEEALDEAGISEDDAALGNTVLGYASTVGGFLPGIGGLISSGLSLASSSYSTATSESELDVALNVAGAGATLAGIPAAIAGLMGIGTGVTIGGVTTIGTGLGASAAATSVGAALAGGAALVGTGVGGLLAGLGLGSLAAPALDEDKGGLYGVDEDGQPRSAFDLASDAGHTVSDWLGGETAGMVAGGVVAGGCSAVFGAAELPKLMGTSLYDMFAD